MTSEIKDSVIRIISEQLSVSEGDIKEESLIIDDLGADSLDTVELVLAFEENFNIEIPDEVAEKITSVKEAIDRIQEAVAAKD